MRTIAGIDLPDALGLARWVAADHAGRVHVVYVAHVPSFAALSAVAVEGISAGFGSVARDLTEAAPAILGPVGDGWIFERRQGAVAHELFAAAEELDNPRAEGGS